MPCKFVRQCPIVRRMKIETSQLNTATPRLNVIYRSYNIFTFSFQNSPVCPQIFLPIIPRTGLHVTSLSSGPSSSLYYLGRRLHLFCVRRRLQTRRLSGVHSLPACTAPLAACIAAGAPEEGGATCGSSQWLCASDVNSCGTSSLDMRIVRTPITGTDSHPAAIISVIIAPA